MTSQPIEYAPEDGNDNSDDGWWARSAGPDPAGDPASLRNPNRQQAAQAEPYRPAHRPPAQVRPGSARDRVRQYQTSDSLRLALQSERARLRARRLEFEQHETSLVTQLDEIASRLGHVEALLANGPDAGPPAALRSIGSPPPAEAAA